MRQKRQDDDNTPAVGTVPGSLPTELGAWTCLSLSLEHRKGHRSTTIRFGITTAALYTLMSFHI
jgi:hypothetical protein